MEGPWGGHTSLTGVGAGWACLLMSSIIKVYSRASVSSAGVVRAHMLMAMHCTGGNTRNQSMVTCSTTYTAECCLGCSHHLVVLRRASTWLRGLTSAQYAQ